MTWWTWMILGAVILGIEMFAIDMQFYLIFLGLSAALVGLAGLLGLAMPEWAQWTAFSVLSLASMVTFRRSLYEKLQVGETDLKASIAGESIRISQDIQSGDEAREEYRGTDWTVRNVGGALVTGGSQAKVVKVDGLTLHVEAE